MAWREEEGRIVIVAPAEDEWDVRVELVWAGSGKVGECRWSSSLVISCRASLLGGIGGGASLSEEAGGPFTATISMALLSNPE
jgi:hypothetical protein